MKKSTQTNYRALNLMIAPELKEQLEHLAFCRGCTMAMVVRRALALALPLLDAVWNAEQKAITDTGGAILDAAAESPDSEPDYGNDEQGVGPVR